MIIILLYFSLFLVLCYYLFTKPYGYWKSRGVPFERPVFIFGSMPKLTLRKESIFETLCTLYNKFKGHPYFGFYSFNRPTLMVTSPKLLRQILVRDFDKFTDRNIGASESTDPIAFHTLFFSTGSLWKAMRTKISPVFTSGKMKLMLPLMQECTNDLKQYMEKHSGEEIEFKKLIRKYTIDIISSCAFGFNGHCVRDVKTKMEEMAVKLIDPNNLVRSFSIFCFFFCPKLSNVLRLKFADVTATNYLVNVFKSALSQRQASKIVRHDLIDLLDTMKKNETLGDDYKFDDIKMSAQAIIFFSAGNDTTAITLSFALHELAIHKEVQTRLREEIRQVYGRYSSFTYEALQEMKYLEMVINETLRKYPAAPFLNRESNTAYKIEETGLVLEKGTGVMVPAIALHYDPDYFPNPLNFDPERFSDENKANIKPFTYMPFGEGPRNCIGQRFALLVSKITLANIIKDFTFEATAQTSRSVVFNKGSLLLQSSDGICLKATKL